MTRRDRKAVEAYCAKQQAKADVIIRAIEAGAFDEFLDRASAYSGSPARVLVAAFQEKLSEFVGEPISAAEAEVWIFSWRIRKAQERRL